VPSITPDHEIVTNAKEVIDSEPDALAIDAVEAGIAAAHPETVLNETVSVDGTTLHIDDATYDLAGFEKIIVLGGGNAAGHVASVLESSLGEVIDDGVVVTDDPTETELIQTIEGSHPVPDERAHQGATAILERAEAADSETLVLAVITGGGSALLPAPAGDISLADLQTLTDKLLASGAAIDEINAVRKHISALKGGRLARAAAPATMVGLLFSDVAGDDPAVIASGPISPDSTTFADALGVLDAYDVDAPTSVYEHLQAGAAGDVAESPIADDMLFESTTVHILASGFSALSAAADVCKRAGLDPLILSSSVRGEAREAAKTHVAIVEEVLATGNPVEPPAAILSGGETTVTIRDEGTGGPNQEFALSAALELPEGVVMTSVDTDGIDGPTEYAGALVDETTATPATEARAALATNNVTPFLREHDELLITGPTGTNINDLRITLIPSGVLDC
jgi:hydroxypyruvate reductase